MIAKALGEQGATVDYVTGGFPVAGLDPGRCNVIQLAPARAEDLSYRRLVDGRGRPVNDAWRRARREQLLAAFSRSAPDVVVIETFPFGRRLLRFELLALLERIAGRAERAMVVSSVRDIIEPRSDPARYREMADLVARHFDLVMVHSDPALVPFEASFPEAERIRNQIRYTGFVSAVNLPTSPVRESKEQPEVVVSAGGGVVGERLLRTAVAAARRGGADSLRWRVLVGPNVSKPVFEHLRRCASGPTKVERNRTDFTHLLGRCRVSISQAGYNTVLDVLAARARALVVPFDEGGEREQSIRAERLAAGGLVDILPAHRLSPDSLAAAVRSTARRPRPQAAEIRVNGAQEAAKLLLGVIPSPPSRPPPRGRGVRDLE